MAGRVTNNPSLFDCVGGRDAGQTQNFKLRHYQHFRTSASDSMRSNVRKTRIIAAQTRAASAVRACPCRKPDPLTSEAESDDAAAR